MKKVKMEKPAEAESRWKRSTGGIYSPQKVLYYSVPYFLAHACNELLIITDDERHEESRSGRVKKTRKKKHRRSPLSTEGIYI